LPRAVERLDASTPPPGWIICRKQLPCRTFYPPSFLNHGRTLERSLKPLT
jgi:hypothetical protein